MRLLSAQIRGSVLLTASRPMLKQNFGLGSPTRHGALCPILRHGKVPSPVESRALQTAVVQPRIQGASSGSAPTELEYMQALSSIKPGTEDDKRFEQHWSITFWRDFTVPSSIRDEELPFSARAQAAVRFLQEASQKAGALSSPQSIAYYSYHLSRMGFFATQGIASVAYLQLMAQRSADAQAVVIDSGNGGFNVARLLRTGIYVPISEAFGTFYQDYENIKNGIYKLPWDMTTPGHKQTNPLNILDKGMRFVREAGKTLQRRARGRPDKVWLSSGLYPAYYLNSWHYQTDGWLSEESAKVYETSTETVFVGRQDAMQRQTLVPMRDFMRSRGSSDGSGMRLLEVACGTGRFATFIKDNYPKLGVTQLDLSPFYLEEARKNMEYWRRRRGGPLPEDTAAAQDSYLHSPAENIPVDDASFDIVTSIYLFHELPQDARRAAVSEFARVLKPGGLVVLTDGLQMGDRPKNDASTGSFQAFNEPNWGTHITTDYGALFSEFGLMPKTKVLCSGTKVLSFVKPLAQPAAVQSAAL